MLFNLSRSAHDLLSILRIKSKSRFVDNNNGLNVHVLEAGFEEDNRPLVLLLHGHPELAYSWRKQLVPLAEQVVKILNEYK